MMNSISSASSAADLHNDAGKYCTLTHEKNNILLFNKGNAPSPFKSRLARSFEYVSTAAVASPSVFSSSFRVEFSSLEPGLSHNPMSSFSQFPTTKPSGDTGAQSEEDDPDYKFRLLVNGTAGDFLENRLRDKVIKDQYEQHAKGAKHYTKTEAYRKVLETCASDQLLFTKNLELFKSNS